MKKMLLLALVAIVAGSAFAATDPAFSGTFDFYATYDFTEADGQVVGANPDADITLNGTVDEWSTVNAELGVSTVKTVEYVIASTNDPVQAGDDVTTNFDTYTAVKAGSKWVGKTVFNGTNLATSADDVTKDTAITLNTFTMTTDITGALGVDGPVGVSLTWGKTDLEAAEYQGVAGYKDIEVTNPTGSYVGLKLAISIIDKINLITAIYPTTYWGAAAVPAIGVDLQVVGLVEGLNFNIYYMYDVAKDNDGDAAGTQSTNEIGLTAGYSMAPISAGLAFKYNMYNGAMPFGVSFAYAADFGLTAGVAYKTDFDAFATANVVSLNLTYKIVADVLDVFVAAGLPFTSTFADDFGIEGGVKAYLGGVTYALGYEHNQVNFGSPNGDDSTGLFFSVAASF